MKIYLNYHNIGSSIATRAHSDVTKKINMMILSLYGLLIDEVGNQQKIN